MINELQLSLATASIYEYINCREKWSSRICYETLEYLIKTWVDILLKEMI